MKTKFVSLILAILLTLLLAAAIGGCGGGGGAAGNDNPSAGSETDTLPPTVPENFTATPSSSNRIDLSWDAASDSVGVAGYRIYRDGSPLAVISDLTVSDTQLHAGTKYCYSVTAFDAAGNESSQTADACATTLPAWSGTKQFGTDIYDSAFAMTTDEIGNVYVTGVTYGDMEGNGNAGEYDIVLVKYNDSGVRQWIRQLGSSADDYAYSVAADANGNVYITGFTAGDLDGNTNKGYDDIILIKYNAAGVKQWTRQFGSPFNDDALAIGVDGVGNIYIAGATSGSLDETANGGIFDIFLVKYNASGERQWIRQLASNATDEAYGMAVDASGNAYITGLTAGDLDGNTSAGGWDMFLVKYDTNGTRQWTRQLGTASDEYGYGVALDTGGNIYVAGITAGDLDGNTSAGGNDVFLTKYNAAGVLQWTRQLGTPGDDISWGIAADLSGNIFIVGSTDGDLDGNTNAGNYDMFLVKYSASGEKQWTRQSGTEYNDEAYSVTVNAFGHVFITGYTYGDLDGNINTGEDDMFIVKYDTNGVKQ